MTVKTVRDIRAQICRLQRGKELSSLIIYNFLQFKTITEKYRISQNLSKEKSKFFGFMNQSEWPFQMQAATQNLLSSLVLYDEINANTVSDFTIFQSLLTNLRLAYFSLLQLNDERIRLKVEEQSTAKSGELSSSATQASNNSSSTGALSSTITANDSPRPTYPSQNSKLAGLSNVESTGDEECVHYIIDQSHYIADDGSNQKISPIKKYLSDEQLKSD